MKEVKIVEIAKTNVNNLYQFIRAYPCLLALPRPNTSIKFRFANVSKPLLTNSPLLLKSLTWVDLLSQYLGSLQIYLPIVLQLRAELGYKGPNAFILLENLTFILVDLSIIVKKFREDLAFCQVVSVYQLSHSIIFSLFGLIS